MTLPRRAAAAQRALPRVAVGWRCLRLPLRPRTARLVLTGAAGRAAQPPDPFTVLGVRRGSSAAEVRRAYVRTIKKLHPDVNPQADTTQAAAQVNDAYAAVMAELALGRGAPDAAALLDAFDAPEGAAAELFVNPFACYGASPLQWEQMQEVARREAADAEGALRRAGAAPSDGAVQYLTPRQLHLALEELRAMAPDATSIEACASYLGDCLLRARRANSRVPRR